MSSAPRTEDPVRTARWAREPRAIATAIAASGGSASRHSLDDLSLGGLVEVADRHPAHAIGDRLADPSGPDGVVGVHRGDEHESVRGADHAEARDDDLASAIAVMSALSVSSGIRLSSSR